jgi:hypothetical protein
VKTRRLAPVGVAVIAAAGLAIAGCDAGSTTSTSPSASTSASTTSGTGSSSARDALLTSIAPLTRTSYKYTLSSGGLTGQGANDPTLKVATLALTGQQQSNSLTINVIAIGTDLWMKLDFGAANNTLKISNDTWFHIDATRLGANPSLPVDPNGGANTAAVLQNAVDVQRVDATHFSGTVDLTKGTVAGPVGQPDLDRLGAKAKAVPFTASVDDQGRLTALKLDLATIDASMPAIESTYSDYGTTVSATKPDAAHVAEAPDAVYQLFKK